MVQVSIAELHEERREWPRQSNGNITPRGEGKAKKEKKLILMDFYNDL